MSCREKMPGIYMYEVTAFDGQHRHDCCFEFGRASKPGSIQGHARLKQ